MECVEYWTSLRLYPLDPPHALSFSQPSIMPTYRALSAVPRDTETIGLRTPGYRG